MPEKVSKAVRYLNFNINSRKLDLSGDEVLEAFEANNTSYGYSVGTELDITGVTTLKSLSLGRINVITGLETLVNLESVNMPYWSEGFSALSFDPTLYPNLRYLRLPANEISGINLSANGGLEYLDLSENALTSIDLAANTALAALYIPGNLLTSINLSTNTALVSIRVDEQPIATATISTLPNANDVAFFDCELDETSVDAVLVALDANGLNDGYADLSGGSNAPPSGAGLSAKASLEGKGWEVYVNE